MNPNQCSICGKLGPLYRFMFNIHPSVIHQAEVEQQRRSNAMFKIHKFFKNPPSVEDILSENDDNFKFVCEECISKNENISKSFMYKTVRYKIELSIDPGLTENERAKWRKQAEYDIKLYHTTPNELKVYETPKTDANHLVTQIALELTGNRMQNAEMENIRRRLIALKFPSAPKKGGNLLRNKKKQKTKNKKQKTKKQKTTKKKKKKKNTHTRPPHNF